MAAEIPRILLAAFGKHPGWNDHIDDLGMESTSVVMLKRKLYFEGFSSNIDGGRWESNGDDEQVLPAFRHEFFWQLAGTNAAGRFWSSQDGKGRGRYPMILCAQALETPAVWLIETALPALAAAETECKSTSMASEVRACLDHHRKWLRDRLEQDTNEGGSHSSLFSQNLQLATLISSQALGGDRSGIYRILYRLDREAASLVRDGKGSRDADTAVHLRVPRADHDPARSMVLWLAFFRAVFRPEIPLLLVRPLDGDWLDVIAGNPTTPHFHCLRAGPKGVPLTSSIPYQIEPAIISKMDDRLDAMVTSGQHIWEAMLETGGNTDSLDRAKAPSSGLLGGLKNLFGGRKQ